MNLELDPIEIRLLGSLIEKDLTTPDYYPMTVAALTAACNQKSNRDPVMSLGEHQVMDAIESLGRKYLVWQRGGAGGRVPRYAHKLAGTATQTYDFSRQELAVLDVLLLRGPQTVGEIRARAPRTVELESLDQVEAILKALGERSNGPFVAELPREPGRRERRFAHRFGPLPEGTMVEPGRPLGEGMAEADGALALADTGLARRLAALEERVDALAAELAALRESR